MSKTSVKFSELQKIYITDILGKAKNDDVWTVNERKLAMLIFSKLSKHRMYGKDIPEIKSLNNPELQKILSKTERRYSITRDEFKLVTGVSSVNIARDIKKTAKLLMKRDCELPNPFDLHNEKSFSLVQFFSLVRYNDTSGQIDITINEEALPYLLYFEKYTVLMFQSFYCLKNKYSLHVYIYCKIFQNKYTKQGEIESDLEEFKKNLGVDKKYKNTTTLKTYLLDVVASELNSKTDLTFEYFLEKSGKRFSKIILKFSQKSTQMHDKQDRNNYKHKGLFIEKIEQNEGSFLARKNKQIIPMLLSYGVSKAKANSLINNYGKETCASSIQKLLNEIEKGKQIKNITGYLIRCIENQEKNLNSSEISMAMDIKKELKFRKIKARQERFYEFDRYIHRNEKNVLMLIEKHYKKEKLIGENEISFLNSLIELVAEYQDIIKNNTPLTTTPIINSKILLLTCSTIAEISKKIEVASNPERIADLKKQLEAEKIKLNYSKPQAKLLIEGEISIIQNKIINLLD